ncbi:MAG TPA: Type 1 glutamine amidotransferase-like domain-containing protein [Acidimicrobiales bacterium]|nr:Type 1 glutamine amidotransferase-like domain-containing protein [Acidimicrobiales bacterium]
MALVGSGEYLPVMAGMEAALLKGRPPRYVQVPTAAGQEGPASVGRWVQLGAEQARRLGVEPVPVPALDRAAAEDPALAALVEGAGLVYLSGGSPAYLAETLRDTRVWAAIVAAWQAGAALAGCSAGAMALGEWMADIRAPGSSPRPGLGVVPGLLVIPHFDRFRRWTGSSPEAAAAGLPEGLVLVGIDEETAMVSDGLDLRRWVVEGRQAVWLFGADGGSAHQAGAEIVL